MTGRAAGRKPRKFYNEVAIHYDGNECLIWPFATTPNGYGVMDIEGKMVVVSRVLCERVNGPAPTPEHQAAHSCGKGHLGCVTKRHLDWKTNAQNQADRVLHGTACRGENHGMAKLTEDQARQVLSLRGELSQRAIAKRFNVSQRAVSLIHSGKNWSHLQSLAEKVKEAKGRIG